MSIFKRGRVYWFHFIYENRSGVIAGTDEARDRRREYMRQYYKLTQSGMVN